MTAQVARTPAQRMADEVGALLRSRTPVILVRTAEELRAERAIVEVAAANKCEARLCDSVTGITDALGNEVPPGKKANVPEAWLGERRAIDAERERWTRAAREKRIRTRKMPGRDAVKVWIDPEAKSC